MPPTEPTQLSDQELIAAALAGDGEAFGQLVKKYQPPLLEAARRHLNGRDEAEDVLQEALLQAYKHLHAFRGEAKFSTWLYAIMLNRIRSHIRHRKSRPVLSLDAKVSPEEDGPPAEFPEGGLSLDEALARRTDAERLHQVVRELKEDFRSIFVMHYFQYLPLEEISRRLGRPLGTIKVYLHRARKAVHVALTTGHPGAAGDAEMGPGNDREKL